MEAARLQETQSVPATIREGISRDIPFVASTWLRSFEQGSALARSLGSDLYSQRWRKLVAMLIHRSHLFVAVAPETPDLILGWLVVERLPAGSALHYVYVRRDFQRQGVAQALLAEAGLNGFYLYTHRTTDAQQITDAWRRKGRHTPVYDFTRIWSAP